MTPGHEPYRAIQAIAKSALAELGPSIHAADTEASIASRATGMMAARGVTATGYPHARPGMSCHELYLAAHARIAATGWENLDFRGNLGHSIERTLAARRYIEAGNLAPRGALGYFTFAPHVRRRGDCRGFEQENIDHFVGGQLVEL